MPDPNIATPPDVHAWVTGGATTAVETPPAAPETPPAPPETPPVAPETAPPAETPPATPSAAEQIVAALVKGGLQEADAQKLLDSARTPAPIKDAIEALLDGKPYPVPKSLTFKLKSGTVTRDATLEQLQREGMMAHDYQRNSTRLADEKRAHQRAVAEWTARDAALKEREKWFNEQRDEMLAAQKDPKKWEEYQEILRLRNANPAFEKLFQDAMRKREGDASQTVFDQALEKQMVDDGVDQAMDWIRQLAPEFPGVNPDRVRLVLSFAMQSGQLENTLESVREVYRGEQEYLNSGPLASKVAEMEAQIKVLTETKTADTHNAATAHALQRNKAVVTSPAGGGPPAPARVTPPTPIPPDRRAIEERISQWTKVRGPEEGA